MTLDELKNYYKRLLIIQYARKPKALAVIGNLVEPLLADMIYGKVMDGFDLDTAVGKQLDILGEYIGLTRYVYGINTTKSYWGKLDYADLVFPCYGWSNYSSLGVGGSFLNYRDLSNPTGTLSDSDYRLLLKYQAKNRSMECTMENADALLYEYFGDLFYVTDNADMTITYTFKYTSDPVAEKPILLRAIIALGICPRPAGVAVILTDSPI